jgi:hypothetical protein
VSLSVGYEKRRVTEDGGLAEVTVLGSALKRTLPFLVVVCCGLLVGGVVDAVEPAAWPEFSPAQAGFSVRFPGTPTEQFDASGGVTNYQFLDGEKSFVVSVGYLDRGRREMGSRKLLEQTKDAFLGLLPGSRLVKAEEKTIGGFPAISWIIEAQAAGRPEFKLKMLAIVANTRLFNIGYTARKDVFVESDADKFIATFQLK